MNDIVNVAVISYSATGSVHRLAEAVAEGAGKAGAATRMHRVCSSTHEEAHLCTSLRG